MDKYTPGENKANGFYVYGYAAASTMAQVLKRAGDNLTRKHIMYVASHLKHLKVPLLLPGVDVDTSPTDFAPIQCEQLQKFDGTTWKLFGEVVCPK